VEKLAGFILDGDNVVSLQDDEGGFLGEEHSLAAGVDGELVADAEENDAGDTQTQTYNHTQ
jgi:hypothetical protein